MTFERHVVADECTTVSLLIWRRFRRPKPGLVETTLAFNPGLASLGPILPAGTVVLIPTPQPAAAQAPAAVRLW